MSCITVERVLSGETRRNAVEVIEQVFRKEKKWISAAQEQLPQTFEENDSFSWFLAKVDGRPAGVLRLMYDPPLETGRALCGDRPLHDQE